MAAWPWNPITSKSNPCASTISTILRTGWPTTSCTAKLALRSDASLRARAITGAKRRLSSSSCSTTSSMVVGRCGISSTQTMCSSAWQSAARSSATPKALKAPSEPSLATRILANMGLGLLGNRLEGRLEPFLRNQRRHHRAADHRGNQNRILLLADDVIGEAEERRDRAEGEAGRH